MGLLTGSRLGSERTIDLDELEVLGHWICNATKCCICGVSCRKAVS